MSSFIKASAMVLLQTFVTTTKKCIQQWNCINLSFIPTEILADIYSVKMHLILKALSEIVADDILFYLLLFYRENKTWHFMWIVCRADDSHEMISLIFSEKKKKWKIKISSAAVVISTLMADWYQTFCHPHEISLLLTFFCLFVCFFCVCVFFCFFFVIFCQTHTLQFWTDYTSSVIFGWLR